MRRVIFKYDPRLKERARQLRNNSTLSEILLWNELKNKKLLGYDFHRQKPIDEYIVDFFCNELMLAIEIDGDSHVGREVYDHDRQHHLEKLGISFLRFEDLDIKFSMDKVLSVISGWIKEKEKIVRS